MSEALRILEANQLMRYIILFKIYIESDGTPLVNVEIEHSIRELFGNEFNKALYAKSRNHLVNKGLISRTYHLTFEGIEYIENWIISFKDLNPEDLEKLHSELPKPVFDFFKFTKGATTVMSFVNQLIKLSERF